MNGVRVDSLDIDLRKSRDSDNLGDMNTTIDDLEKAAGYKRLGDDEARALLARMGNYLDDVDDVSELNSIGFNKMDKRFWDPGKSLRGMRRMLKKYRRQLSGAFSESEFYSTGAADKEDTDGKFVVKWQIHPRFGSVNVTVDGRIDPRSKWEEVRDYHRDLGMFWSQGWYVLKNPEGFDEAAYIEGLEKILGPVKVPEVGLREAEAKKAEALEAAMADAYEIIDRGGKEGVDQAWEGLATEPDKFTKVMGMRYHPENHTFEFRFPKGKISTLFSNKAGQLGTVTRWDTTSKPWSVHLFDVDNAKDAIEKAKKLVPGLRVATDGLVHAEAKKQSSDDDLQTPIPEVASKMDPKYGAFPYQNEGIRFLQATDGKAMLGDEMGLGKTLQVLGYAVAENKRVIAVVPKTVRRQWLQEADKFFPGHFKGKELDSAHLRRVKAKLTKEGKIGAEFSIEAVITGTHQSDDEIIADALGLMGANLATINYESLTKFAPYLKAAGFDTLVVDESHRIKNPEAQVTKAIEALAEDMPHRILMSGTAIKNARDEFFTQFKLVAPGLFATKAAIRATTIGELWERMRPFYLARQKRHVLRDLPPKTTTIVHLPVNKKYLPDLPETLSDVIHNASAMGYIGALKEGATEAEAKKAAAEEADEMRQQIAESRELASRGEVVSAKGMYGDVSAEEQLRDAFLQKDIAKFSRTLHALAYAKTPSTLAFIKDHLDATDGNFLVFTESEIAAKRMAEELGDIADLHTGKVSQKKREDIKAQFNPDTRKAGETKRVLVATRPSLAVGANLTSITTVIFNDKPWTPADIRQAEDRAHRATSTEPVNVIWITAAENKMDQLVTDILHRKAEMQVKSAEGGQLSPEEKAWMDKPVTIESMMHELTGGPDDPDPDPSRAPIP